MSGTLDLIPTAAPAPTVTELLAEGRSLIASLDPDWTDHNASDPGIMLVELLAWLHEMLFYRLESVPEESIRAFLTLLTGNVQSAELPLPTAVAETMKLVYARRRLITPEDHRSILQEAWPTLRQNSSCDGLGLPRVELHAQRNLEGSSPTAVAPGHQSIQVWPEATEQSFGVEVTSFGVSWSFETASGTDAGTASANASADSSPVTGREPIVFRPELIIRQAVALTLTSPRGSVVFSHTVPTQVPVMSLVGQGPALSSPSFSWAAGGSVTVELWLRLDQLPTQASTLLKVGTVSGSDVFILRGPGTSGIVDWEYGPASSTGKLSIDLRSRLGEWVHLAFTAGASGRRIFLDGVVWAESTTAATLPAAPLVGLEVGAKLTGALAELRLWRTSRDSNPLQLEKSCRLTGSETGLAGYWPLSETSGSTAADRSPQAQHLSCGGGGQWGSSALPVFDTLSYTPTPADVLTGRRWTLRLDNPGSESASVDPSSSGSSGGGWAAGQLFLSRVAPGTGGKASAGLYPFCTPSQQEVHRVARWLKPAQRAALSWDGTAGYAEVKSLSSDSLLGDLTLELWIRPRTLRAASLMAKARSGELDLAMDATGKLSFRYGTSGNDSTSGIRQTDATRLLVAGRWQHVAVVRRTCSGGAWVSIYIDGQFAGGALKSSAVIAATTLPLKLGAGWAGYFQGEMAEVRIWQVARPVRDLLRNRFVSVRSDQTGLLASWPVEEGEGAQIVDRGKSALRGDLYSPVWSILQQRDGNAPPPTVPCVSNSPAFCGAEILFNHVPVGSLGLEVASSLGSSPLGSALRDPSGNLIVVDKVLVEGGASPHMVRHRLSEDSATSRLDWRWQVFQLNGQLSRLEGVLVSEREVEAALRSQLKGSVLEPGRLLTTRYHVVNPSYVPFSVTACLYLKEGASPAEVRRRAIRALRNRFHATLSASSPPFVWPLGRGVCWSDVYGELEQTAGVDFVVGGPWPGSGGEGDPSQMLTVLTADATSRQDSEVDAQGKKQVIGFKVASHELPWLQRVVLYTARKRGTQWQLIA